MVVVVVVVVVVVLVLVVVVVVVVVLWLHSTYHATYSGEALVRLIEGVLAFPHDAARVVRARAAHGRRCKLREAAAIGARAAGGAACVLAVGWLLWEASELRPDGSGTPGAGPAEALDAAALGAQVG